jgi:Tol biopolymer transport system component
MTSAPRFERDLPELLAELAAGAPPNYRDDIVQRVAVTPQRPAWTFPEGWLPMAILSRRLAVAYNVPWRSFAIVALLAALLAVALSVFVASQPRVPAPFGLASNGAIAYSLGGDIVVRDGPTGVVRTLVAGPGEDITPTFSLDGTKIGFVRLSDDLRPTATLMVVDADGRNLRTVAGPERGLDWWVWSPSGKEMAIVSNADVAQLSIVNTEGEPNRRVIDLPIAPEIVEWRPPDGRELIIRGISGFGYSLFAVRPDGSGFRQLAPDIGHARQYLAPLALSPDGRLLAYGSMDDADVHLRLHLLDLETGADSLRAAGSPPLSAQAGTLVHDGSPAFSPDGTSLVYNRYFNERDALITAQVFSGPLQGPDQPISPAQEIPSGTQSIYFQFSPDGTRVLMRRQLEGTTVPPVFQPQVMNPNEIWIADLQAGGADSLGWTVDGPPAWQRRAP